MNQKLEKAKAIVEKAGIVFSIEEDEDSVIFSTRENGDVGEEMYSPIDLEECARARRYINEAEIEGIKMILDTCDEWSMLIVKVV